MLEEARKRKGGLFVEVGTYDATFAVRLMEECQPAKLVCVDPYAAYDGFKDAMNEHPLQKVYETALSRLAPYGEHAEILRQFSEEAAQRFADNSLDFVYIDGNHSYPYVLRDLEAWFPKVKSGGIICGDDAVDQVPNAARNADGDIKVVWSSDKNGNPTAWGYYGVLKAAFDFATANSLQTYCHDYQFLITKP